MKKILILLILIVPFIVIYLIDYFRIPAGVDDREHITLVIDRGASVNSVVDSLFNKGLIDDKELFILWLKTMDMDRSIKAGFYEIPQGLTYAQLVSYLSQARSKEIKVRLVEGWKIPDIALELKAKLHIDADKFIALSSDSVFISELGINRQNLEGYLLPDTYLFYWGVDEKYLVAFLVNRCLDLFTPQVRARLDSMKMSIHEILTLASIIEGEAIFDDERTIISSVYHNRLRRRIKLQADPTIQYILPGPPRRLLFKDLEIDSPYNTYKYYGLPPGPISNPGKKSILAAIYPEDSDYLFFVAKGDGRHTFSRTAAGHARAKEEFDKVRREVKRKERALNTRRENK